MTERSRPCSIGSAPAARQVAPRLYTRGVAIGPAPVLALLVGGFHTGLFVFARGRADARVLLVLVAACLGAWAGDATGGRLGIDPLRIGDFHLFSASIVAWAGIGFVAVVSILGPADSEGRGP